MNLKECKSVIRDFLRTEVWTDQKLCALLAHAEDKLSMWSCCCLIGVATADHALMGRRLEPHGARDEDDSTWFHYDEAEGLPFAEAAEAAFRELSGDEGVLWVISPEGDELRRRRIRPIIRAEIRRRERLRQSQTPTAESSEQLEAVHP